MCKANSVAADVVVSSVDVVVAQARGIKGSVPVVETASEPAIDAEVVKGIAFDTEQRVCPVCGGSKETAVYTCAACAAKHRRIYLRIRDQVRDLRWEKFVTVALESLRNGADVSVLNRTVAEILKWPCKFWAEEDGARAIRFAESLLSREREAKASKEAAFQALAAEIEAHLQEAYLSKGKPYEGSVSELAAEFQAKARTTHKQAFIEAATLAVLRKKTKEIDDLVFKSAVAKLVEFLHWQVKIEAATLGQIRDAASERILQKFLDGQEEKDGIRSTKFFVAAAWEARKVFRQETEEEWQVHLEQERRIAEGAALLSEVRGAEPLVVKNQQWHKRHVAGLKGAKTRKLRQSRYED